jgi:hypothetical protein
MRRHLKFAGDHDILRLRKAEHEIAEHAQPGFAEAQNTAVGRSRIVKEGDVAEAGSRQGLAQLPAREAEFRDAKLRRRIPGMPGIAMQPSRLEQHDIASSTQLRAGAPQSLGIARTVVLAIKKQSAVECTVPELQFFHVADDKIDGGVFAGAALLGNFDHALGDIDARDIVTRFG